MTANSLDFEEGYRAGILQCLKMMTPTVGLWDRMAQMYEESAARTDSILRKSRQGEKE